MWSQQLSLYKSGIFLKEDLYVKWTLSSGAVSKFSSQRSERTLVVLVFQLVYPQDVKLTEKEVSSDEY